MSLAWSSLILHLSEELFSKLGLDWLLHQSFVWLFLHNMIYSPWFYLYSVYSIFYLYYLYYPIVVGSFKIVCIFFFLRMRYFLFVVPCTRIDNLWVFFLFCLFFWCWYCDNLCYKNINTTKICWFWYGFQISQNHK